MILLLSTGAYFAVGLLLWYWLDAAAIIPLSTLLLAAVYTLLMHQFRVRERQDASQLRQFQALLTLYTLIPFKSLPPWLTGWAATPEFGATLYEVVRKRKPEFVLELGSGASTIILAAALKQNGHGSLISVDQDEAYAASTRSALKDHQLNEVADVVHAPIVPTSINGEDWLWYDREKLQLKQDVDLLVIDGPNRELQKMARFPAIPLLFDHLADDAVIVLDDANRKDERRAVQRWLASFGDLDVEFLETAKGTAVISRRRS